MRLALHQLNPTVGDLAGNEAKIADGIARAREQGAQLVVFPELAVCGYPPEDLLLREDFLAEAQAAVRRLADHARGLVALVGFPERAEDVYNSLAVLADGELRAVYRKMRLPNYGVFDEVRWFQAGDAPAVIEVDGVTVGLTICEDMWVPGAPATDEALAGAEVLVCASASPYHAGKPAEREQMLAQRARDTLSAVAFCGQVGGQDELVFDGSSVLLDHTGRPVARAAQFEEELLVAEIDAHSVRSARLRDTRPRLTRGGRAPEVRNLGRFDTGRSEAPTARPAGRVVPRLEGEEEIYAALVLGTRDYVEKNRFKHVALGVSGGADSALVLAIAVDALGPERVTAVVMPSPYSSEGTQSDARTLARRLGVQLLELPIGELMEAYDHTLAEAFAGRERDTTEENIQARIRGNLLMALSNKFGWLVLTTGNKSEMSVGYSTLYGDSAGGFAVIKDCPKTLVYQLLELRSRREDPSPIPETILTRAPSAELRPGQTDQDSLPPYDVLDAILEGYVEQDLGREQLLARGLPADQVDRVMRMVDVAEYKRRQSPPGIKVTSKAFGRDRRVPITNRFSR